MSQFVEEEPVKIDTPPVSPAKQPEPSPKGMMGPPEELHSPIRDEYIPASPSPQKKRTDAPSRPKTTDTDSSSSSSELVPKKTSTPDLPTATPIKTGIKRKLGARGDTVNSRLTQKASNENQPLRLASGKPSIRERAEGRTLKELSSIRKGERPAVSANRKPLSAKSTNDDISSPKKAKLSASDDVATAKADMVAKGKPTATVQDRPRGRGRPPKVVEIAAPTPAPVPSSLAEVDILSPHSPPSAASAPATDENSRGGSDTPPPADISSKGETSRASRRSRGVVSYAEPNLRDKMRRPTKDMVDAVTGSRRSSQFDMLSLDASATSANSKRQSTSSAGSAPAGPEPGSIPASPLAKKGQAEEREDGGPADADLYEFKTSSPKGKGGRKKAVGRPKGSRRFSTALDEGDDDEFVPRETSSRRRSMLV